VEKDESSDESEKKQEKQKSEIHKWDCSKWKEQHKKTPGDLKKIKEVYLIHLFVWLKGSMRIYRIVPVWFKDLRKFNDNRRQAEEYI
jgi:hypothetical protein